jgi:hypothetical protein
MFVMRRERHCLPANRLDQGKWVDEWIDAEVMDHESGFTLTRLGHVRPIKGIMFRYLKGDVAFGFYADRCHWGGTVTGTYLVSTNLTPGEKLESNARPIERAEIEAIAADINLGLRAWPSPPAEQAVPIGVVHFFFGKFHWDRLAFGEPLALRALPVSSRWLRHTVRHRVNRGLYGPYTYRDCASIVRDDGVQLVRTIEPEHRGEYPDDYHYVTLDVSFFLTAERRLGRRVVTDTWEVHFDPSRRDGLSPAMRAQLGPTKCAEIVRNVEEAFLAWPYEPYGTEEQDVPVNRVVFLDAP